MDLLLVADGHYVKTLDGKVYAESVYNYDFYKRYLMVYDHVYAVVRLEKLNTNNYSGKLCSGEGVTFLEFPTYKGPWQYLFKYLQIKKKAKEYSKMCDCAIFRLPGAVSNVVCQEYIKRHKPFGVEVVVDPWENFAPGAIKSITRPIVRYLWTEFLKKACITANGAAYVTDNYLQKRYPSKASKISDELYFESSYSSVELPDSMFSNTKKYELHSTLNIIHVSNDYTGYGKGHLQLMDAVKLVVDEGYSVKLTFVGDGILKDAFIKYSKEIGIDSIVQFLGRLPDSSAVREVMRKADLFVFPTRAEGLPRVLLEAMAEGLPCISSPTCGIPEILSNKYLCNYEDTRSLANLIELFLDNPELISAEGERNKNIAKKFSSSILNNRRKEFYEKLKTVAVNWGK